MKSEYEIWFDNVEKLKKDIDNAKEALIQIAIAEEIQSMNLIYAKKRLANIPKPVIMEPEEKPEEEEKEEEQAKE